MKPLRASPASTALLRNLRWAALLLVLVHVVGTVGFLVLDHRHNNTAFDAFYMTFTTIATIGYGEIIDLSGNMPARLFNVLLATSGIAMVWVMFSNFTALLLERSMDPERRRRKMLKEIQKLRRHYLVCGVGRVGFNVARELHATRHAFVAVDEQQAMLDRCSSHFRELGVEPYALLADATEDDALLEAGIREAHGVFAVTGDDGRNMVISLAAKQLNPRVRVVARVHDVRNIEKCRRAGADEIVSPDFTGGLRIASAMIRPHAATFMDQMLRRSDALRVEEVKIPEKFPVRPMGSLGRTSREAIVVAMHEGGEWVFNPPEDTVLRPGLVLIVIATPAGRQKLETALQAIVA